MYRTIFSTAQGHRALMLHRSSFSITRGHKAPLLNRYSLQQLPLTFFSTQSPSRGGFWKCRATWKRARVNTLRCLVGCTLGDFSMLWALQAFYPQLGMGYTMALSMASGIAASVILETLLLRFGKDRLSWQNSTRTAAGMNMVSMLAMELTETVVDFHLTSGVVVIQDPQFWLAAATSAGAGYLVPLPYNYFLLKKYGKACH